MDAIIELLQKLGASPAELEPVRQMGPFLIPLLVVQAALMVAALIDLLRRPHVTLGDRKWAWALIILLLNLLGPILYFALGRVKYVSGEQARPVVDMDVAEQKAQAIVDKLYGGKGE